MISNDDVPVGVVDEVVVAQHISFSGITRFRQCARCRHAQRAVGSDENARRGECWRREEFWARCSRSDLLVDCQPNEAAMAAQQAAFRCCCTAGRSPRRQAFCGTWIILVWRIVATIPNRSKHQPNMQPDNRPLAVRRLRRSACLSRCFRYVASSHKHGQSSTSGRSAQSHCLNQLVDPPARHAAFAHEASAFRAPCPAHRLADLREARQGG